MNICKKLFGKKNYIKFYCLQPGVKDLFPIEPINKLKRKWVEQNPVDDKSKDFNLSWTQNCPAIKKIMSTGFVVRSPIDIKIETLAGNIKWSTPTSFKNGGGSIIDLHPDYQSSIIMDDIKNTAKNVIKINLPWRFEISDDLVLLLLPVSYNNESRFYSSTGIADGRHTNVLNVQLFWKLINGNEVIEAGTPLCQIIPIRRDDLILSNYEISIKDADDNDIKKINQFNYAQGCKFSTFNNFGKSLSNKVSIINNWNK